MVCGADAVEAEEFDDFEAIKQQILETNGLPLEILPDTPFEVALKIARITSLSKDNLYFHPDAAQLSSFNPRDCAVAASKLVNHAKSWPAAVRAAWLSEIDHYIKTRLSWENNKEQCMIVQQLQELPMTSWASEKSILTSATHPAIFRPVHPDGSWGSSTGSTAQPATGDGKNGTAAGGIRGLAAAVDIAPGDVIVEVPESVLIWQETAEQSDLGRALAQIPNLDPEFLLLIWTMVDSADESSELHPFWKSLPQHITSGLTLPQKLLFWINGTPLHDAALQAQQHMEEQFQDIKGVLVGLLKAYPDVLSPQLLCKDRFMWAAQLWYAYGMQVQLSTGDLVTCLVPYACLLNHNPWPHCVHYGKVDPQTKTLRFCSFQSASAGSELFLSYGDLSNTQLLLFYGIAFKDNPCDILPLDINMHDEEDGEDGLQDIRDEVMQQWGVKSEGHMLRAGPLAPGLMAYLRVMTAQGEELKKLSENGNPHEASSCPKATVKATRTLYCLLRELQLGLPPINSKLLHFATQQEKDLLSACRVYVEGLHKIVEVNLQQCVQMGATEEDG